MHIATLAAHLPMCLWSENCSIRSITCKENAKSLKREVLSCGIFTFGISLSTLQLKFFLPSYKDLYNDLTNYSKVMTKHSKFSSRVVQGGAGAPSHTHSGKAPFIPFPSCRSQIHLLHLLQVLIHTSNGFPPSSSTPFPISDLTWHSWAAVILPCSHLHHCHCTTGFGGSFLLFWFWWQVLSRARGPLWLPTDAQPLSVCQEDAWGIGKTTKYSLLSAVTKCQMWI